MSVAVDTSRIASFPGFADLPATELDELAAALKELEVEAGATVTTLDGYGSSIYFIEQGEAAVLTDSGESAPRLGPGDTFGEIAPLRGSGPPGPLNTEHLQCSSPCRGRPLLSSRDDALRSKAALAERKRP
jgi:CRP-like cAMP-binding protein